MRISGFTFIKFRVKGIEVFGVQLILDNAESFAKTLEMYDFPGAKELYGFIDIRIIPDKAEDIVIGGAGFLFGCHIFKKIRNGIAL